MGEVLSELDRLVRDIDEQKREMARRKQEHEAEAELLRREAFEATELRHRLESVQGKLEEASETADSLRGERDGLLSQLEARGAAHAEVCRQHDAALRASNTTAWHRALLSAIIGRRQHEMTRRALQRWRRGVHAVCVALAEATAARHALAAIKSESRTRAAVIM